jgi:FkbM family methyltransferase
MLNKYTKYYKTLHNDISIPQDHIKYISNIEYIPKVVFDIGSAVLHWTKEAKKIWPNATYIAFEAMKEVEEFYKEMNQECILEVLSDVVGRKVVYNCHPINLGGNSYYKENEKYSKAAKNIYTKEYEQNRTTITLDQIMEVFKYPQPDLIKIDTQGSELDILKGAQNTIKGVKHLIVELQHVQYNIGAKLVDESLEYINSLGFELFPTRTANKYFCGNGPDADYHFIRKN